MSKQKGIFWLASYPKSGNTWFRLVLTYLLKPPGIPFDLNVINTGSIISSRKWADNILGFDSADFSHEEMDQLRPALHQWYGVQAKEVCYHKIHDAYTGLVNSSVNPLLIPQEGCLGAVYFIRNPLDIAISFAHHLSRSIDEVIEYMGNKRYVCANGKYRQYNQLRHWVFSWSMHVESWAYANSLNKLVIRYEDMKLNPVETFSKAVRFLNISVSEAQIKEALDNTCIEKLQVLEDQHGFVEKPFGINRFFRKGLVGDWQNTLSATQIAKIIADHGTIMRKYGYLDENHQPLM